MPNLSTANFFSLIVVNYNSNLLLKRLITSLKHVDYYLREIIVIDNASDSKTFRNIHNQKIVILENKHNLGFAKAVNQGILAAKSNHILLINPDTLFIDDSIKHLIKLIKHKNTGVVGGKIINANTNQLYPSANIKPNFFTGLFEFTILKKIFPHNRFSHHFWPELSTITTSKPTQVDSLCGAFMAFPKYLKKSICKFDESYFLYLEDLQFCLDIRKRGYHIMFVPKSHILHYGGGSNTSKYGTVLRYWYQSRLIFFRKNFGLIQNIILVVICKTEELFLHLYHYLKNEPLN